MKKIAVLYHGDCRDGIGGAWAAWKKFGGKAEYIPLFHEIPANVKFKNKTLYFVDFLPRTSGEVLKLRKDNKVVGIDHHISGEKIIAAADERVFDLKHSGAVLAWNYFHPDKPVPHLLRYIEDSDIWKLSLPHTKEVGAWLGLYEFKNFKDFDGLVKKFESATSRKKFIEDGRLILAYANKEIDEIIRLTTTRVVFEGKSVLAVNSPVHRSQIGHILAKKTGTMGIVWVERDNVVKVSLRSVKNFDVSKIAEKYGGGGHKNAASFIIEKGEKMPWKTDKDEK